MNARKISLNIILSLILLLSVMQMSIAASSVVEVTKGSEQAMLCPRETGLFTDVAKNTDSRAREFTITTKGSAAGWATSVPNGFILLPGESKTIYTYATPVQDAVPSTYDLSLTITSEGSNTDIVHKVIVKKCYGSTLSGDTAVQRVCPNEAAKYEMLLSNNGEYKESFSLETDGQIKNKATLSDRVITLEKGETKKVVAYVNAPAEDGSYSFNVKSQGNIGKTLETFNAVLNVDPCYSFNVDIKGNNSYSMCERTMLTIPMQVENKGTVSNTFAVNVVEGPGWARFDKNEFKLLAGEREFVTLAAAPTYGIAGDFNVKVNVVPEKGDKKAQSEFNFNVRKCHSVKAMFLEENTTVCNGLSNSFEALVTNDGEFQKQYAVNVEAPSWVSSNVPEKRLFTLEPGKQQKFTFTARPGEDVNESLYPVNLNVIAVDDSKSSVFANAQAFINTLEPAGCYKPSISTQYENVTVYYDSTVTLPLSIKNEGLSEVAYDIVLSGTASNFVKLTPAVLTIGPGKSDTSYLYIAPTPQLPLGQYDAVISLKLKDGAFLLSRRIPVTVTDDKSLATSLGVVDNNLPIITLQEEQKPSLWSRFKGWLYRNFAVENNDAVSDDVSNLDNEVSEASAEVDALAGEQSALTAEETGNESAGVVVIDDTEPSSSFKETVLAYRYYILAGIIVLLVIIILIRLDAFGKAKDFFEEDDEK